MDCFLSACRIVDLLVQGDVPDDPLLESVRQACHDRRWHDADEMMRLRCDDVRSGQVEDVLWSLCSWESAYDIVQGVHWLASHLMADAMERFVMAEKRLGKEESHVRLVSLVAVGFTYKTEGVTANRLRAAAVLSRAERIARRLSGRSDTERDRKQQHFYETLSDMLQATIEDLRNPVLPRLIPVVRGTAGQLRYVPSDDFAPDTSALVVDKQTYRLLRYQDRELLDRARAAALGESIQSDPQYFLFDVEGDSMWGARAQIRSGDRLLVLANADWQSAGNEPVVVQEAETQPRVKFVKVDKRTIMLRSANPRYGAELYAGRTRELKMLGIVKAILEEQ